MKLMNDDEHYESVHKSVKTKMRINTVQRLTDQSIRITRTDISSSNVGV